MQNRIIFHIDMDAFFASVEVARDPSLAGKAVIIGGSPEERGVVSTCSYEARKFGVHSAMPMAQAKRLCPHAIFLRGDYLLYRDVSRQVMAVLQSYTKKVEIVSIDEAYLDVTDVLKHRELAPPLAQAIKESIQQKTALTSSVGIASSKLIAKIISSIYKPNGIREVPPGQEQQFLSPLPVSTIPGIGKKTRDILSRDGITMIHHLQQMGMEKLIHTYGARGYQYFLKSLGRDNRPVVWEGRTPKSLSAETTFDTDTNNIPFLRDTLATLTEKVWKRLKKKKMRARVVTVKVRDYTFKTITRSKTFQTHTRDFAAIFASVHAIFDNAYDGIISLRLLGVSLDHLTDHYWQPTFWD